MPPAADEPAAYRRGRSGRHSSHHRLYVGRGDVGLGAAEGVDELEVRWPSGRVDRWGAVAGGRYWTLTEGAAAPEASQ